MTPIEQPPALRSHPIAGVPSRRGVKHPSGRRRAQNHGDRRPRTDSIAGDMRVIAIPEYSTEWAATTTPMGGKRCGRPRWWRGVCRGRTLSSSAGGERYSAFATGDHSR
jgi:hypothetical protein